jgi:predicted RNase H-like HicB family nuclease
MQYTIVLEPQDTGYIARCVEIPGAIGHGDSRGEALARIREAIELVQKTRHDELHTLIHEVRSEIIKIEVADAA